MALGAYQKLTRVVSGKPFGDGSDSSLSSASIPTMKVKDCSGTATSTTLTADTDASPFEVGDILLLHQSRGTGVGQWEVNKVTVVGSDEYTLAEALNYTYTESGDSQAQAIVIKQYTDVTVQSGTWTLPSWDTSKNGILVFAANGTVTVTGTIDGDGADASGASGGTGAGGFRGSAGGGTSETQYNCGEGTGGAAAAQRTANGNGGGGGKAVPGNIAGGGGGGNGTAGGNGGTGDGGLFGYGGAAISGADLVTGLVFGGGAGGTGASNGDFGSGGGAGGGIVLIFAKDIQVAGGIKSGGGDGGQTVSPTGAAGAGGSILLIVQTATLGTTKITAPAGSNDSYGGTGGVGKIAVHRSGTVTGTTTPTFNNTLDSSLIETNTASFFAIL